ncbi:MAG TPA: DUF4139 domain-containing protein, partial [Gemmataceae bacterium]|nr:DUF4139 domain-containing protein [Gemmataceae bacterium]
MRRTCLCLCLIGAVAVTALVAWRTAPGRAQPAAPAPAPLEKPAAKGLPLAQVILFSSGVGYFQREGTVEGNARVDLSFPATDVNDLLKSLVLQDRGQGKIGIVSYDGMEPLDKTLKSFALDLTTNPTFGQLLNQARGEKVEIALQTTAAGAASGTVTGVIVGMESQADGTKEVHQLNLLCAEGVRCVPLAQVQRMRFLSSTLDGEFRRALDVLAASHNSQKRSVSLHFLGEGKRPVRVGYVVENPIWKTSYRLVMDKKSGKLSLQGWAVVENTTDEDWSDVRMALVSSRPISFVMDLYQPLFLPRPTVEPERFASLRPPAYQGALTANNANLGVGVGGGGLGALGALGGGLGALGGFGGMPAAPGQMAGMNLGGMAQLGGQFGQQGGQFNRYQLPGTNGLALQNRLTFEELQERRKENHGAKAEAKKVGSAMAAIDPTEGVSASATGEEVGDSHRYVIDQKVSLPRQKSALLPLVNQEVAGTRVSIYDPKVQAKFPLLGLKFKNTTGQPLTQGPVSVYEGGTYAGDARILDLQPNEERLLAYAIDQGMEVKAEDGVGTEELTAVRVNKGLLRITHKLRETKTYLIKNRSSQDRALIVEQPVRQDWKLVEPAKPAERSREAYRFEWKVPAGKSDKRQVVEEKTRFQQRALADAADRTIRVLLNSTVSSPKVKEALRRSVDYRAKALAARRDLELVEKQLKTITDDQARMRANLGTIPKESAAYKRILAKFDTQEVQIEKLQAQVEKKQEANKALEKEFSDYLAGLT